MELNDRVVVVTGGTRGIGRAIVLKAVSLGNRVVFCGRSRSAEMLETEGLAEQLAGSGRAIGVVADVCDEDAVDALFDDALDRFERVDVAVHCAGINRDALLVRSEMAMFDEVIATNLTGAFLVARRAVQEFLGQGDGGRIVCIGSLSQEGATSQAAYAASKGGLLGLSRTVAKEYGSRGITSNVVVAGLVESEMTVALAPELRARMTERSPLRRAGTPDEVARVVMWLASPGASYVNGTEVSATGGLREIQW